MQTLRTAAFSPITNPRAVRLTKGLTVLALPFLGTAFADGIYMTNMQSSLTPASISVLTASTRVPGGQSGDVVEYVLKATVGAVSATGGPGVYFTTYLPTGSEVLGAWFVTDATGTTIRTPGQGGRANDGWGARGSKTPFGNPFSSVLNGRQNDVYGDTGIFYSTDTRTQFFTADGSGIAKGPLGSPLATGGASNGYNVTDTFYKAVDAFNFWDALDTPTVIDASALGSSLSDTAPLPSTTNAVRWSFGYAALGDVIYVKIRVRLTSSLLAASNGVIMNFDSTGSDNQGSGSKDNPWRYFGPTVAQSAAPYISKEIALVNGVVYSGGNIPAGATVTYHVRYLNIGTVPINSTSISDTLTTWIATAGCSAGTPSIANLSNGVTISGVTAGSTSCPAAGATVTFGNLPNVTGGKLGGLDGGEFTYDVKLSSAATNGSSVTNTAKITSTEPVNNNALTASASGIIGVVPQADLAISKTGPANLTQGDPASYTLTVWNRGGSATSGATVVDTMPTNITGVIWACTGFGGAQCSSGVSNTNGSGNLSLLTGNLPVNSSPSPPSSGAYLQISVTGTASTSGNISNTATVTAPSGMLDPSSNNSSSVNTSIAVPVYSVSGPIWDDANASLTIDSSESGTNPSGLSVYAVDAGNLVVGKASVQADGTYSISGLLANTYTLRLSSDASKNLGDTVLAPSLPAGWINTGENIGGTTEITTPGEIAITVGSSNLTKLGFGIEKLPNTDNQTVIAQINPGGTNTVQVPTITYTDLEDNAGISSTAPAICIETLPANATLAYNGSSIGSAPFCIAGYNPALLTIDPQAGDQTVLFTVSAKDAAGQKSATPATISMTFTNQAPSADAKTGPSIASSAAETTLSSTPLTGTDPDGSVASFRVTTLPNASEGTLKWDDDNTPLTPPVAVTTSTVIPASSADKLFFDPSGTFTGTSSFAYVSVDEFGLEASSPATYSIPVANTAPVANDDVITTAFNTAVNLDFKNNDTDLDGTINTATIDLDPSTPALDSSLSIAQGTFTLEPDGTVKFTPTAGFVGAASTSYTIQDSLGQISNTATLEVTVIAPPVPVATNDSSSTAFNTPVILDAKLNDTSSAGTTLNANTVDLDPSTPVQDLSVTVTAGTFMLEPDGTIKFTPVAGFVGAASTTYTIQDSLGQVSNPVNLTVTVNNSVAPVAVADTTTTPFNTAVTVDAKSNDVSSAGTTLDSSKIDLDPSTAVQDSSITVAGGVFTLEPDGTVQFAPVAGFVGTASTPYTIQDSLGQVSNSANLMVTVSNPSAPVATNDLSTTAFNMAVTLDVKANDASSAGTTLDSSKIDLDPSTPALDSSITVAGGTFTLEADGTIKFTPTAGFVGVASTMYTIQDNLGQTSSSASLTVTVSKPAAPVAASDTGSTAFNTPVSLDVKLNDSSSAGTTLDSSTIDLDPSTPAQDAIVTVAAGTFSLEVDGTVKFTPTAGFVGTATTPYAIQDSLGQTSNTANLTVTVNAPAAPVATNDTSSTPFDTSIVIDVKLNDTSSAGTTLDSSKIDLDPSTPALDSSFTVSGKGTFSLEPDGTIKFVPVAGIVGSVSVSYTIQDSLGQISNVVALTVTVINPNGPTASNDSASAAFNTPVTIDAKANDFSSAGTTLNSSKIDLDPSTPVQDSSITVAGGVFTLEADGTIKFVPTPGFVGTATASYTIQDSLGQVSNPATVTVTVSNPPAPVATNDSGIATFNTAVVTDVKLNDTSSTGTTLVSSKIDLDPSTPALDSSFTVSGKGTFSLEPDGTVKFTPVAGFTGMLSTPYTIQDSLGQTSNSAALTITVNPALPQPIADLSSTALNTPVVIDALANDAGGINPASLSVPSSGPGAPSLGMVTVAADGKITYTPNAGVSGTDTFSYTVCNTAVPTPDCATASITVNIAPQAINDSSSTAAGTPVTFAVASNDLGGVNVSSIDLEPTVAGIQSSKVVTEGLFTANADGTVSFSPAVGFSGPVAPIAYTIQNAAGITSPSATITVNVTPQAFNDAINTASGAPVNIAILSNDLGAIDPGSLDLDPSTPGIQTSKTVPEGTFSINPDSSVKFVLTAGFNGPVTPITYAVKDSSGQVTNGTVSVNVGTATPPIATSDALQVTVGGPTILTPLSSDTAGTYPIDPSTLDLDPSTPGIQNSKTIPGQGVFVTNPDGSVAFTPDATFSGAVTPITYTIADRFGNTSNPATVNVTVTPKALNDTANINAGETGTLPVSSNDLGTINPGTLDLEPGIAGIQTSKTIPGQGVFVANPNGSISFTPEAGFSGPVSPLTYQIQDSSAQVTSAILSVNVAPKLANDNASTYTNNPVTIKPLANDQGNLDPSTLDLDPSTPGIQTTFNTAHGTLKLEPDGSLLYTPNTGFDGTDSFTYGICDHASQCVTAVVNLSIGANLPPVPTAHTEALTSSTSTLALAPLQATDNDDSVTSYTVSSLPNAAQGKLWLGDPSNGGTPVNAGQVLTPLEAAKLYFVPVANFSGAASFSFSATDDRGAPSSTAATVTIPVNAAPVTHDDTVAITLDTPVTISVLTNDTDLDGTLDPSSIDLDPSTTVVDRILIIPNQGTFTLNTTTGEITFIPQTGFTGSVTVPYSVQDNKGAHSNTSSITVNVQAGTVAGHVFNDLNGNGIQDANENNLAGIGVNITPEGKPAFTVRTDANGDYSAAVPAGNITINVSDPANSRLTTGNDPQTLNVADNASVQATPVGFQGLEGGLSGRVFEDLNGNGQQDANEPGIAGASFNITARDGTSFSVTSDANGDYNVPTLTSGPASIEVITPDGFVLTSNNNPQTVNVPAGKGVNANPVGFIKPGLSIQLEALQKEVQVGGTLEYKIRVLNTTPIDLQAVEVVDELPVGVVYQPGTARIAGLALEPRIEIRDGHQVLVWTLPNDLPANASTEITFATTVTPKATGNLANKASAKAQAGPVSAPVKTAEVRAAVASVKIVQGNFSNQTALVGRVYFDKDMNSKFDPSKDEALAGARVYLSDGRYAITDAQGRYNFAEL
jgi:uncharacterized repeat protein (TIGR01451 family)